jgi:hypothetical protein
MAVIIQIRRGTAAQWTTANTVLADGEMGYEKDTSKFKFGDGTTAWNALDYIETGGGDAHFLGKYISLAALETAHATAADGDYAIVDAGPGTDAKIYIWDADEGWVEGGGTGASTFADLSGSPNDNAALNSALLAKQDADADLSAIAALTPTNDDLLQRKSGAWTNRTPAQVKTDLALSKSDVGLSNVDNTADANKPVSTAQGAAISAAQSAANGYTDTQIATEVTNRNNAISTAQAGIKWKQSVRAATTANITLSAPQTIDGVSIIAGDRVLVKNQTTQTENGIYLAAAGSWARASDADTASELQSAVVMIEEGTANADTGWRQTSDNITIGSSNIVWGAFGSTAPPASETVPGIAEISTQAETDANSDDSRMITALKLGGFMKKLFNVSASWPLISSYRYGTVMVDSASSTIGTIGAVLAVNEWFVVANKGLGNANLVGSGVTLSGDVSVKANRAVLVLMTSASTAMCMGGSTVEWFDVLSKPTSISGYAITNGVEILTTDLAIIGNATTVATDLKSYTIGANRLDTNGQKLFAVFAGNYATSVNSKKLEVIFDGTVIYDTTALAITTAASWIIEVEISRITSTTQFIDVKISTSSSVLPISVSCLTGSKNLATPLVLKVVGTATANNDVTSSKMVVSKKGT